MCPKHSGMSGNNETVAGAPRVLGRQRGCARPSPHCCVPRPQGSVQGSLPRTPPDLDSVVSRVGGPHPSVMMLVRCYSHLRPTGVSHSGGVGMG